MNDWNKNNHAKQHIQKKKKTAFFQIKIVPKKEKQWIYALQKYNNHYTIIVTPSQRTAFYSDTFF